MDLATLADRQAIADLLARFCERIDEYDIDAVAELFADDCIVDYGPGRGGERRGREALRERLRKGQGQFRRTHHQLGQTRIEITGDRAAAVTYVTARHERWDGAPETAHLQYRDLFDRSPAGWLICERRVFATIIEGFEGVEWKWVPRAEARPEDRER